MEVELKTDQDGDSFAVDRSRSKQISLNGSAAVENDSVSSALATTEGTIAQPVVLCLDCTTSATFKEMVY